MIKCYIDSVYDKEKGENIWCVYVQHPDFPTKYWVDIEFKTQKEAEDHVYKNGYKCVRRPLC